MSYSIESFGKLLISGEYLILKGAKGLSIPVNFSQTLNVDENTSGYFVKIFVLSTDIHIFNIKCVWYF